MLKKKSWKNIYNVNSDHNKEYMAKLISEKIKDRLLAERRGVYNNK